MSSKAGCFYCAIACLKEGGKGGGGGGESV